MEEGATNASSIISVSQLRNVLTQHGKMKLSDSEVDDLINKVSPESIETGVIDYHTIVDLFVKDFDKVNICGHEDPDQNNLTVQKSEEE